MTLGHTKSDNINRMITVTDDFYLVILSKWEFKEADNINQWLH